MKNMPKGKMPRRKIGPGGPVHWRPIRATQKGNTRWRISVVIDALKIFPTRAAVVTAGKGSFSPSSVDRHIDLIDAAQVAANSKLLEQGLPPQPLRKSNRRLERWNRELIEERDRTADLAKRLKDAERKIASQANRIAVLEERVRRYEKEEAKRRSAMKKPH